jgi:nucleoside-diphosphate-sugar epimerase
MSFLKQTGKAMADVIPGLGRFTFDDDAGTIFITSGTGVLGYRVAMSLLEAGHKKVRVGIWKGEREIGPGAEDDTFANGIAYLIQSKGGEVINFDWKDESTYKDALKGCQTVFCTIPHVDDWQSVFPAFLNACKDKKVEHFVKISFLRNRAGFEYCKSVDFVKFHSSCDDFVENAPKSSRISYTILCTSHIMATPLLHQGQALKDEHKYVTASYGMGVNYVSPNDVADAAVVVLLNQKPYRNTVYNLTGPGPIYDSDVAKLLSKAYNTEIKHIELGYNDYKKNIKSLGLPDWLVKDSGEMEKMKASGVDEFSTSYTNDIEKIIGKKPETFAEYLDNKNSQRPGRTFP